MDSHRIKYLDGLRGVLAVIVFVHHYFYLFCPDLVFGGNYEDFTNTGAFSFYKIIALTPINIFFNPGMAIHFFFLLSGYVQTQSYFLNPDVSFLQKSMLKRYFRLAIPVVSVLMLGEICNPEAYFLPDYTATYRLVRWRTAIWSEPEFSKVRFIHLGKEDV